MCEIRKVLNFHLVSVFLFSKLHNTVIKHLSHVVCIYFLRMLISTQFRLLKTIKKLEREKKAYIIHKVYMFLYISLHMFLLL